MHWNRNKSRRAKPYAYGKCNIRRILPNCLFLIKWEKCSRYRACGTAHAIYLPLHYTSYNVIRIAGKKRKKSSTSCIATHRVRLPAFPTWFLRCLLRFKTSQNTFLSQFIFHQLFTIHISLFSLEPLCTCLRNWVYHWQCFVVNHAVLVPSTTSHSPLNSQRTPLLSLLLCRILTFFIRLDFISFTISHSLTHFFLSLSRFRPSYTII